MAVITPTGHGHQRSHQSHQEGALYRVRGTAAGHARGDAAL